MKVISEPTSRRPTIAMVPAIDKHCKAFVQQLPDQKTIFIALVSMVAFQTISKKNKMKKI